MWTVTSDTVLMGFGSLGWFLESFNFLGKSGRHSGTRRNAEYHVCHQRKSCRVPATMLLHSPLLCEVLHGPFGVLGFWSGMGVSRPYFGDSPILSLSCVRETNGIQRLMWKRHNPYWLQWYRVGAESHIGLPMHSLVGVRSITTIVMFVS